MGFVGHIIFELPSLYSTNDYCKQITSSSCTDEGTVVWTRKQIAGRGRGSNRWESEDGKNLTFSVILKPIFLEPANQFFISMAVSLGITAYLKKHTIDVKIKWPNDIYIGDKKIAGILIENSVMDKRITQSIVGIGLNLNQIKFSNHLPNPVSLKQIVSRTFPPDESLKHVCSELNHWYRRLKLGELKEIKEYYISQLYRLNEKHPFRDKNEIFQAYVRGVDNFGRLAMEIDGAGIRYFGFNEVGFVLNN